LREISEEDRPIEDDITREILRARGVPELTQQMTSQRQK
jgi:hypothetical protein